MKTISKAFKNQGWDKPVSQYLAYARMQHEGLLNVVVAELKGEFAAYLTIKWEPDYQHFREQKIPEIVDLNVLEKFQRQGIATSMMDEAELKIKKVSPYAGIGFGIFKDYGPAQILYIRRGYIPDGYGLVKDSEPLKYGENVVINDDLVIYLIKKL